MRKKTVIVVLSGLFLAVLFHFAPIYNKLGYIVHPQIPGQISSDLCIGYSGPEPEKYRIIPNGLSEFKQEKSYLKQSNQAAKGSSVEYGCSKPVTLKLYLW